MAIPGNIRSLTVALVSLISTLVLSAPGAFAQSAGTADASAEPAGKSIALFNVVEIPPPTPVSGSQNPSQYAAVITDSLRLSLVNAGFSVLPMPAGAASTSAPELSDQQWSSAANAGARFTVAGVYTLAADRLLVQLSAYDTVSREIVAGTTTTARTDLSLYNTIDQTSSKLAADVNGWNAGPRPSGKQLKTLTIAERQNGTVVSLPNGPTLGTVQGGELVIAPPPLPVGNWLYVDLSQDGYYPRPEAIHVTGEKTSVRFRPLRPKTSDMFTVEWTLGQLAGAGLGYRHYLSADEVFVSANGYAFAQLPSSGAAALGYHLSGEFLVGTYVFFPPQTGFRLAISTGAGGYITVFPGRGNVVDPFISVINPTLELNLRRVTFFLQIPLRFILSGGSGLLSPGILGANEGPIITIGMGVKR